MLRCRSRRLWEGLECVNRGFEVNKGVRAKKVVVSLP
jgi:hypothetical protein